MHEMGRHYSLRNLNQLQDELKTRELEQSQALTLLLNRLSEQLAAVNAQQLQILAALGLAAEPTPPTPPAAPAAVIVLDESRLLERAA